MADRPGAGSIFRQRGMACSWVDRRTLAQGGRIAPGLRVGERLADQSRAPTFAEQHSEKRTLKQLAGVNGGLYYHSDAPADVERIASEIMRDARYK